MSDDLPISLKRAVFSAIEENTGLSFGDLFQAGLEYRLRRDGKLSDDHWKLWRGRIPPQGAAEMAAAIEIARSQNAVLMQDVVALKAKLHDAENAPCAACATRVQHTDANPCDLAIGLKEELAVTSEKLQAMTGQLMATCIDHERDLKMLRGQPPEEVKKLRESNETLTRERDLAMRECDDLRAQRDRARHEAVEATINVERLTNERDAFKAAAEAPEERSFYIELAGDQVKVTLARMKT